jgi:ABC-type phosphate transport system permease subunit
MERGLIMVVHGIIIGLVSYAVMIYGLKQGPMLAENRSVLVGALAVAYMVVFGHQPPTISALKSL